MSHIADKAGFLAALAANDPERKVAEEHARTCCVCRDALEEGRRLVRLLAEAPPLPPPTAEALKRAALLIEAENRSDRRARRILGWCTAAAVLAAWCLQLVLGTGLVRDAGSVSVSLMVLALALAGAALVRANRRLVVATLVLVAGLFACVVGVGMGALPQLSPKAGAMCTLYELGAAGLTWLVAVRIARLKGVTLDKWHGAGVAAAGALASGAAQHLTCPVSHSGPHLLVFHFGGVVLAAMLGARGVLHTWA